MLRYQPYMNEWIKVKHSDETMVAWMNGVYVRDAIGSNFSKKYRYPQEPIMFFNDGQVEEDGITDVERFSAWAQAFNSQFSKKVDDEDTVKKVMESADDNKEDPSDGDLEDVIENTIGDNETKD